MRATIAPPAVDEPLPGSVPLHDAPPRATHPDDAPVDGTPGDGGRHDRATPNEAAADAAPAAGARTFTRRRAAVAAGVLALAALGTRVLRPTPAEVEVAPVARAAMRVTVDADAVTRVRARYTVAAPVAGYIERLALAEGDTVRAGDVVAVLTAAPADATARRVAAARVVAAGATGDELAAGVAQATAALTQAERDAGRMRRLAGAGAVAPRDVETSALALGARTEDLARARARTRGAGADGSAARAALSAATGDAAATVVRAPAAGRVLRVPERSARVVAAGTPLVELGDPTSLEVAADVLSSDAAAMHPGQPVALDGWGGGPLAGHVRRVEPSARTRTSALGVDEQRLTVLITLDRPPAALGDGYRLQASTTVWTAAGVLTVPAGALLRSGTRWQVLVVDGDRARRREVRVGHLGGGVAEVLGGVREGERVILFPPDGVVDGARVRPITRAP